MKAPLRSLVAFAACLILVLPPGTCGLFTSQAKADGGKAKRACCHKSSPVQPCQPGRSPTSPTLKCCCTHDDALPQKAVQAPLSAAFALSADFVLAGPTLAVSLVLENRLLTLPAEPLLHILLCVWRC
jgi:hypothetical protein